MGPDVKPVESASALQQRILAAMESLGREPDLERIVRKAALPVEADGRLGKLAPEAVAAFDDLVKSGRIRCGTRGGWRLAGRF